MLETIGGKAVSENPDISELLKIYDQLSPEEADLLLYPIEHPLVAANKEKLRIAICKISEKRPKYSQNHSH